MASARSRPEFSVTFDKSSFTFVLTNEAAIKIKQERELLNKTYEQVVHCYLPPDVKLSSQDDYIESRFKALCAGAERRYKSMKGRAKAAFLKKERSLTIPFQVNSCSDKRNEESVKDIIVRALEEELGRVEKLSEESINQLKETVRAFEQKCLELEDINRKLILKAGQSHLDLNKGKMVGEGSRNTDHRKLLAAGSSILQALERTLESYGLDVCQLLVTDIKSVLHQITCHENGGVVVSHNVKTPFSRTGQCEYSLLSPSDKKSAHEVTALLDSHYVSNLFWDRLSATVPNLPSKRLVNSYRDVLDARVNVFKTPGPSLGAQVCFEEELKLAIAELAVESGKLVHELGDEPLLVKIEGDGCVVSRRTAWTTLSFVIVDGKRPLQSHRLHRLLAVVECPEKYFDVRESLGDLIEGINAVTHKGYVSVGNHKVAITICLGSDLKFLLVVQGLQSASSRYPCPFCRADPQQRCAAKANSKDYNEPPLVRTYENMREDCLTEVNGMKNVPLFVLDPSLIIPDVLHMRIRIVNRLIDGLLSEGEDRDNRDKVLKPGCTSTHLQSLVSAINSCGVKFDVWADERKGRTFTSLQGSDCALLLRLLPEQIRGKLDTTTEEKTLLLWKLLHQVLNGLESGVNGRSVQAEASLFLDTFLELGMLGRKGYGKDRVTPYIHILAHHASSKQEAFNCLGWFSSQGVEKKNDVLKHLHHSRSNKWNSAADALKLAKRLEANEQMRKSRGYRKLDVAYWHEGLIQQTRAKRPRCADEIGRERKLPPPVADMDAAEVRTELRALGVSTAVKSTEKLRDMLRKEKKKRRLQT